VPEPVVSTRVVVAPFQAAVLSPDKLEHVRQVRGALAVRLLRSSYPTVDACTHPAAAAPPEALLAPRDPPPRLPRGAPAQLTGAAVHAAGLNSAGNPCIDLVGSKRQVEAALALVSALVGLAAPP
jgi:hypothetical protein